MQSAHKINCKALSGTGPTMAQHTGPEPRTGFSECVRRTENVPT